MGTSGHHDLLEGLTLVEKVWFFWNEQQKYIAGYKSAWGTPVVDQTVGEWEEIPEEEEDPDACDI